MKKTRFSRNSLGNRKGQVCKAHHGFDIRYAGVCYGCKKRLHLIPFSWLDVKLIFELSYPDSLKTRCALTSGFIFQQDGATACSHGKAVYDGATLLPSTEVNVLAKMTNKLARPQPSCLSRLGSYAGTLQDISSQVGEHWPAEASLAANVGSVAAGPDQQGHTELHKKNLSLC